MNEEQKRRNILFAVAGVAVIAAIIGISMGVRTLSPQPQITTLPVSAGGGGKASSMNESAGKVDAASGAPAGVDSGAGKGQ
jgi:hypothetical protein